MKFLKITSAMLVASTALCCAASANADDGLADGWYVSGNLGIAALRDADLTAHESNPLGGLGSDLDGTFDFDTGHALSVAIGRSFGNFRVEGELSYRRNKTGNISNAVDPVGGGGITDVDVDADLTALSGMANAYYDFETTGKLTPFVMAGLGGARLTLDADSLANEAWSFDESDTVFAYQAGGGVGYAVAPDTDVTLSYRYFATADPTFDAGDDKIKSEYGSHNLWVGLTHRF